MKPFFDAIALRMEGSIVRLEQMDTVMQAQLDALARSGIDTTRAHQHLEALRAFIATAWAVRNDYSQN